MADALTAAARQVRIPDRWDERPIHKMTANRYRPHIGRFYSTACRKVLSAAEGAVLTTRTATCLSCIAGGYSRPGPKPGGAGWPA